MSAELKVDPKQCKVVTDLSRLGKLSDVLPCIGAMLAKKPEPTPAGGQPSEAPDPMKSAAKAGKGFVLDLPAIMKKAAGEDKK